MALIGTRAYLIDFDDGVYSLRDIVETLNNGELCVRLRTTIKQLSDHCTNQVAASLSYRVGFRACALDFILVCMPSSNQCDSCRARAFVCELCKSNAAIFPFQVRQVATCPSCQVCRADRYSECLSRVLVTLTSFENANTCAGFVLCAQSAFHRDCIAAQSCPKCARIAVRRQSAAALAAASAAEAAK